MLARSQTIAIVTAQAARELDDDLPMLLHAFASRQQPVEVVDWDDAAVDWSRYVVALLRSTWDYTQRLPEFLAWSARVSSLTRLENPHPVVRWNVDKHYLDELAERGVKVVPSRFVAPAEPADGALQDFLGRHSEAEVVVKPCVGAGSRDAQRHARADVAAIIAHMRRLLDAGRSVLLQPYQQRVDAEGETALIHVEGTFSHAIRKAALLTLGAEPTRALFQSERITACSPAADELAAASVVLAALPFPGPLYARVDLIRDSGGAPLLLELELIEPSLFFDRAPGSAETLVDALLARVRRYKK